VFDASQLVMPTITDPALIGMYALPYSDGTDIAMAMENGSPVFYVSGYIDSDQGSNGADIDALLVKFDAQGNTLWSITYNGLDLGGVDVFNAVTVDDNGYVYVTGSRAREVGRISTGDMILAKYSSDGAEQFMTSYKMGTYDAFDDSVGNDVFLNADGEIFVVGGVYDGPEGNNIAAWRYDNDGNNGGVF
jgi:hypothetical protein